MDTTGTTLRYMRNLELKIELLEKKVSVLESNNNLAQNVKTAVEQSTVNDKNNLCSQLAETVTGIIGLKEFLTCEHRLLKFIWACLLCVGIGATIFYVYEGAVEYLEQSTATSVKLVSQAAYDYPPLLLCPDGWLDAEKAESFNISKDAITYSLGYVDYFDRLQVSNISAARREFVDFFRSQNWLSLPEYFKSITVDLETESSLGSLADQALSSAYCKGCEKSKPVEKVCMNGGVCYAFSLKPDEPGSALGLSISSNSRTVILKLADKTKGLMHVSLDWELYFSSDLNLLTSVSPYLIIQSNYYSTVKLNAQKFLTLNKPEAPCAEETQLPYPNYTTESCMAKCQNDMYQKKIKCQLLPLSSNNSQQPDQFCNTLDRLPLHNMTVMDFIQSNETADIDFKHGNCSEKCPYKCQRILYQATLEAVTSMLDFDPENLTLSAINMNMSLVYVDLVHSATFQGGISTLTEMITHSSITLVSNVGGTLGLFVGATAMTFVQVILFFVNYAINKIKSKNKKMVHVLKK